MSLRRYILEAWGVPADPPEGVERASTKERLKRNAWMVISSVLSLYIGFFIGALLAFSTGLYQTFPWSVIAVSAGLLVGVWIDLKFVFPWGVEAFALVPPWQFRVSDEGGEQA